MAGDGVMALISSNWLVCEIANLHMMKGRHKRLMFPFYQLFFLLKPEVEGRKVTGNTQKPGVSPEIPQPGLYLSLMRRFNEIW